MKVGCCKGAARAEPMIDRLSHDVLALIATEADEALALSSTCKGFADVKRHVHRLRIVAPRQDYAMNWRALAGFTQCTHAEVCLSGVMGQPRADMFSKEAMTAACRYLPRLALLRMPWHGNYQDHCVGAEITAYAFVLSEQVCVLSRAGLLPASILVQHPVPYLLLKSLEHSDQDRDFEVLDDERRDLLLNYYPKHRLASFLLHSGLLYKEDPQFAGIFLNPGRGESPVNERAIEFFLRPLLQGGSNPGSVGMYDAVRFERGSAPCSFRAAGVSLLMDVCAGALNGENELGLEEYDINVDFMTCDYARGPGAPPIPGNPFLVALVAAGGRFETGEKAALLGALRAVCPLAEAARQEAESAKRPYRSYRERHLSSQAKLQRRAAVKAQYAAAIAFVESVPDT